VVLLRYVIRNLSVASFTIRVCKVPSAIMLPTHVLMLVLASIGQSSGLVIGKHSQDNAPSSLLGGVSDWEVIARDEFCTNFQGMDPSTNEHACVGMIESISLADKCGDFFFWNSANNACYCGKKGDPCEARGSWAGTVLYGRKPCEETGTCTVVEDPHIEVFDGAQVSLFAAAANFDHSNKWLVKSSRVSIQARYMTGERLQEKSEFVRAVAIGGPFLEGNIIIVGSLEDPITFNGKAILQHDTEPRFQFQANNISVEITQTNDSSNVADLSKPNRGLEVKLPLGVSLIVNRLHRHLNAAIKMPKQEGGQEGLCGNFNGMVSDDSLELSSKRLNLDVADGESFFAGLAFA
jgi:hypothetical protein